MFFYGATKLKTFKQMKTARPFFKGGHCRRHFLDQQFTDFFDRKIRLLFFINTLHVYLIAEEVKMNQIKIHLFSSF